MQGKTAMVLKDRILAGALRGGGKWLPEITKERLAENNE